MPKGEYILSEPFLKNGSMQRPDFVSPEIPLGKKKNKKKVFFSLFIFFFLYKHTFFYLSFTNKHA
jgi:hypothetical protein